MPKWELWCRSVVLEGIRAYLGVGVLLDGDAQRMHFGPGVEVCIARPALSVAAPETQLSCSGAWLATACPSPAAAGGTQGPSQARPLAVNLWVGAETPTGESLFQERAMHRLWAVRYLFLWAAAF